MTCYDDLDADVLLWMKNGGIDYAAPQLYWSIGFVPADYEILVAGGAKHLRQTIVYRPCRRIKSTTPPTMSTEPTR
ncbi:MAG: hypothetical protein IPL27_26145 [Lewinellaceae bacterium]|nr:hypothetical protein [Lewinellaceae bacterium]